jgi:hypothetical protein
MSLICKYCARVQGVGMAHAKCRVRKVAYLREFIGQGLKQGEKMKKIQDFKFATTVYTLHDS